MFPRPMALVEALASEEDEQLGLAILDFGFDTTTISVYKNGEFLVITTQTTAELIVQALGYTPADEATLIPLSEEEITQICTEFLVDDDDESSDDESVDDESV